MNVSLPRYVKSRPGEAPDAYLVDGDRVTPLSQVERSAEGSPLGATPQFPAGIAEIDAIAEKIASIGRAHREISGGHVASAAVVALETSHEGLLAMHRREIEVRKGSAL